MMSMRSSLGTINKNKQTQNRVKSLIPVCGRERKIRLRPLLGRRPTFDRRQR